MKEGNQPDPNNAYGVPSSTDLAQVHSFAEHGIDNDSEGGEDDSDFEESKSSRTPIAPNTDPIVVGDSASRKRNSFLQIQTLMGPTGSGKQAVDIDSEGSDGEDSQSHHDTHSICSHESVHAFEMNDLGTPSSTKGVEFFPEVSATEGIAFQPTPQVQSSGLSAFFAANADDDDSDEDQPPTVSLPQSNLTAKPTSTSISAFFAANAEDDDDDNEPPAPAQDALSLFAANVEDDLSDGEDEAADTVKRPLSKLYTGTVQGSETTASLFAYLDTPGHAAAASTRSVDSFTFHMSDDERSVEMYTSPTAITPTAAGDGATIAAECRNSIPFSRWNGDHDDEESSDSRSINSSTSHHSRNPPGFIPPPPTSRPPSRPRTPGASEGLPPPPPPPPITTPSQVANSLSAALFAALGDIPDALDDLAVSSSPPVPAMEIVPVSRPSDVSSAASPPPPPQRSPSTPHSDRPKTPLQILFEPDPQLEQVSSPNVAPLTPFPPRPSNTPPVPPSTAPPREQSQQLPSIVSPPPVPALAPSAELQSPSPISGSETTPKRRLASWPPPSPTSESDGNKPFPKPAGSEERRYSNSSRVDAYLQNVTEGGGSSASTSQNGEEEAKAATHRGSNAHRIEAYIHTVQDQQQASNSPKAPIEPVEYSPEARPSIKANKLNLNSLLQRTMDDKMQGVDAAQAVRRISMMRNNPEAMQAAQAMLASAQPSPDPLTLNMEEIMPPQHETPVTRILTRASSQRRLQSLTGNSQTITSSAFNSTVSPIRSASMQEISPLSMDGAAMTDVRTARKRGAITAVRGTSSNRESPVTQLYSRDGPDLVSIDDMFKLETLSKDEETMSNYTLESTPPISLTRSKSVYQMLGEKKKSSRPDTTSHSGSSTPIPRPSQDELKASVQTFTSSIKRTMSQASMAVDLKKARADSMLAAGKPDEEKPAEAAVAVKEEIVRFPTLDGLEEDDDEAKTLFGASSAASSRISPQRRTSVSGNGSLASLNVPVDTPSAGIAFPQSPEATAANPPVNPDEGDPTKPSAADLMVCQTLMTTLFPSLLPTELPAVGQDQGASTATAMGSSSSNPYVSPQRMREQHEKLNAFFTSFNDALRPGVLRVYRLIEIELANNINPISNPIAPSSSASPTSTAGGSSNVVAPIPRRRQSSLTLPSSSNAVPNPNSIHLPVSASSSVISSSGAVNRRASVSPGSEASRANSVTSGRTPSILNAAAEASAFEPIVPTYPSASSNTLQGLLEIILQRHQRRTDAISAVRMALKQYLLYEEVDDVMIAAEYLLQLFQRNEDGGYVEVEIQELYKECKLLCMAFSVEDSYLQSLRGMMEEIQSVYLDAASRNDPWMAFAESKETSREGLMSIAPSAMTVNATVLKTEAASICAQMMVFLIPCNLALIELLFKLSLVREAIQLHLQHYKSIYKSQAAATPLSGQSMAIYSSMDNNSISGRCYRLAYSARWTDM